jgi:uncharacterized protein (TIGR02145 family)
MKKIIFSLICLSQILFSQDVFLSVSGHDQTSLNIYMENITDVYGFQFDIDVSGLVGGENIGFGEAISGRAIDAGFLVSPNPSGTVLGFSLVGAFIPPGAGVLVSIEWNGFEIGAYGEISLQITNIAGLGGIALSHNTGPPYQMNYSILGCTDPDANNYNPQANIEDGSCLYDVSLYISDYTENSIDFYIENTVDVYGFQFHIITTEILNNDEIIFIGASGGSAEEAGFLVTTNINGLVLGFSIVGSIIPSGEGLLTSVEWNGGDLGVIGNITLQIDNFAGIGGEQLSTDSGNPYYINYQVYGCTDPEAINYIPDAFYDDGSCYYLSDLQIHFNPFTPDFPISPMGVYIYSATMDMIDLRIGDEIGIFEGNVCIGFFQLQAEIDTPLQLFLSLDNPDTPELDGYTSGNPLQFRYWDESEGNEILYINHNLIEGSGFYTPMGSASVDLFVDLIYGCTNNVAINYNENANVDDGSCILPIIGCMLEDACNFNPEANVDDGSCLSNDCMDECGGEAIFDDCGECSGGTSNHLENSDKDCNDDCFGSAYLNDCQYCVGGNTELSEEFGFDCDAVCDGEAFIDECGCVGGTTGNEPQFCFGCTDQYAVNYDETATYDDDSCLYPSIGDMTMDGVINVIDLVQLVDVVLDGIIYIDYMDLNQDGFLNIIDIVVLVEIILNPETLGCTDPNAPNYNPLALYDDGSCDYSNLVIDIDGNVYETVVIGDQEWMAENLGVTHYRNGDEIATGYSSEEWISLNEGAYTIYNNDPVNEEIYGNLYNWLAVDDERNICPESWYVPSDDDWQQLVDYLGGYEIAGGKLKETGYTHWNAPNYGATNETGFTALPGGRRQTSSDILIDFVDIGMIGNFWTSSPSPNSEYGWFWFVWAIHGEATRSDYDKNNGMSVRCIKNTQ